MNATPALAQPASLIAVEGVMISSGDSLNNCFCKPEIKLLKGASEKVQSIPFLSCSRASRRRGAFSIIELLMVVALMGTMMALVVPAITGKGTPGNMAQAAYDVAGVLESARSYATANNTYVWVGFFEEDATKPGTAGVGRVIVSAVASRDGTMIYNPNSYATIPPDRLIQINKLLKIDNLHLRTATNTETFFPVGEGTGNDFLGRPTVSDSIAQIGDVSPPSSATPFQYPVGTGAARYTFSKVIQFSPRGEVCVASMGSDSAAYGMEPTIEIGLQLARGAMPDTKSKDLVAVQITGIAGNVTIYRR